MPNRQFAAMPDRMLPWCLGLAAAVVCGDALLGDRIFAWRDAIHTFPGLVELTRSEWLSGSVPLWNPLLNGGQPLAAMNVAGAVYPLQAVAAVLLPTGAAITVVVVTHLLLAGWAAAGIARDAGHTAAAATVAGLVYAFGGSVVFQAYHPNIAAGAAWLAWAIRFGVRLTARWSLCDMLGVAVSLAMAVLAGDPQAAYFAGIVLAIHVACTRPRAGSRLLTAIPALGRLAASAALAAVLAWPQIAITAEFMATTTRYADAYPVSIWDVPRCLRDPDPTVRARWADVIIGRPPAEASFYHQIYRFSVAPWRLLDLASPTLAGPLPHRWTVAAGFEGEVWVASLYSGVVPLACVVLALARRPWSASTAGWACIAGFAYLASMGGFGIVGVVRHATDWLTTGTTPAVYQPGDEVGGISWLLTTLLPGYAGFRSPGKWLSCFALAGGQLAAVGFDVLGSGDRPQVRRILGGIAACAAGATLMACLSAPPGDRWFIACGGAMAVASAAGAMMIVGRTWGNASWAAVALATLTAIDLALAGRTVIESAPLAAVRAGSGYLESLAAHRLEASGAVAGRPRLAAIDGTIDIPSDAGAVARARAVGIAQRCNTPLLHGWGKIAEPGTAMEADVELLCSPIGLRGVGAFPRRTFDRMAVEFFVIPAKPPPELPMRELSHAWSPAQQTGLDRGLMPAGDPLPTATPPALAHAPRITVIRNEAALPRVRITRDVVAIAPLAHASRSRRVAMLAEVAFPQPGGPPPTATFLETSEPHLLDAIVAAGATEAGDESIRITRDEPRHVIVEATLATPGCLVLADTFHDDWTATISTNGGDPQPIVILRADHVLRGCLLPAGRHVLEFEHRSATFARAWPIAAVGWVAVAVLTVARTSHSGRRRGVV